MATNGKMRQWRITYQWRTGPNQNSYKKRQFDVSSTYKPTRSVARRLAEDDLLKNVLDASHGQYGYRSITHVTTAHTA
jgi:hypothetical protein